MPIKVKGTKVKHEQAKEFTEEVKRKKETKKNAKRKKEKA